MHAFIKTDCSSRLFITCQTWICLSPKIMLLEKPCVHPWCVLRSVAKCMAWLHMILMLQRLYIESKLGTSQPEFDKLFIKFEAFLIFMCFFRAIGKIIAKSGGPAILTDSGVLAPGSLRGVIECLNYNRCKRLHSMLALALEILLFDASWWTMRT